MLQKTLFFILCVINVHCFAQSNDADSLSLKIENTPQNIQIDQLKAYLGKFTLNYENNESIQLQEYKLVDWKNQTTLHLNKLSLQNLKFISFLVGVDSSQTLQGVMEGDLDPIKGMFWTWQTGYINFKFDYYNEQETKKSFHIGGYRKMHNSVYRVTIDIPQGKKLKGLSFDVQAFLEFVKSKNITSIMSPGEKAVLISQHYNYFINPIWNEATH
ncbi:MAG: hypothetical protein GY827_04255 [Cytophagales bacterium]|nr:hypothetical protein [Cytophagales bacterium]